MIVIVSSSAREASAVAAIASRHPRTLMICSSVAQFRTRLRAHSPAVVVTRAELSDGYSDEVIRALAQAGLNAAARVIVLARADCPSREEARQLALGADCVLRDPLRPEVLFEYLGKYLRAPVTALAQRRQFALAGAEIQPDQRQIHYGRRTLHLPPMQTELARVLAESEGRILTYDALYAEIFDRAFPGETSNVRVLLGRLVTSYRKLGLNLRAAIRVLPKRGYLVVSPAGASVGASKIKKPRPKSRL